MDHLSAGGCCFGIGGGWNREEMENHGTEPTQRWEILRERVLAMKEIWTKDEAEYHGEYVNFDPIWSWPKPVQKPHPPILDRRQRRRARWSAWSSTATAGCRSVGRGPPLGRAHRGAADAWRRRLAARRSRRSPA